MFIGQYEHSCDNKGRIIIPNKFRADLGESFIVARGLDKCINIYTMAKWNDIVMKLNSLPQTKKATRDYARMILSSAMEVSFDKTGRINISNSLMKLAQIEKDCLVIGVGDHVEIWSKASWEAYEASLDESFEDIAEELIDFDI